MADIMVKVDDEWLNQVLVSELKDTLTCFEENLKEDFPNIFFFGDDVKDKAMIKVHIDALKLVIDWYSV